MNKILALAPHTDDIELGVGGTISKLLREGKEVYCVAFSGVTSEKGNTFNEYEKAMKELGVKNHFIYHFPIRYFHISRQEILQEIINIRDKIEPDAVFLPSTNDFHQDHQVICREGIRAFKNTTLLGYEFPWNNLSTNLNYFCGIEEKDLKKKIKALKKYESQKHRPYMRKGFIKSWAELTGIKINTKYAESFEAIRIIL